LSLSKEFSIIERFRMQVRWENFDASNRTNLANSVTAVDAGNAGQITDIAVPMRNMQLGVRLGFDHTMALALVPAY
jgi:hypothetical protein